MSTALGVRSLGNRPLAGLWSRAAPSADVVSPAGYVSSPTVTLSFTYSSPIARAQYSYQYQIRTQAGESVLYDSGTVVSTATSGIVVPYLLADSSAYQIWVRVSDLFDTGEWATETFTAELADVSDYPDNVQVGSLYEVAINGTGHMLANTPERPYRRSAGVLDPPRFATGETPFSEAIERYTLIGQADWSGGAGQEFQDRPRSDGTRFFASEGVDPFGECLRLLHDVDVELEDTYTAPYAVVAAGTLYVVTADGELSAIDDPGDTPTVFTITGAAAPASMTSDGTYWYYCDTDGDIFRNSSAADPTAEWNAATPAVAYLVRWASDRIAIAYTSSGDAVFSTLGDDGAEEVSSGRGTYANATITDITSGGGYTYFAVQRNTGCTIMAWQNGSTDAPFVSLVLPAGQSVSALGFYLGNVFIRATEVHDGSTDVIIYRAVGSEGRLTAERVVELENESTDHTVGDFSGDDRFVYFSWRKMNAGGTRSGVGCIDLSTGGYSTWFSVDSDEDVRSIVQWDGLTAFTVDTEGLFVENTAYVTSGFLETSQSDLASGLDKVVDDIKVTMDPLGNDTAIAVSFSLDGGDSYTSAGDTVSTAGSKVSTWTIGQRSPTVGIRVVLTSNSTATPCIRTVQTRVHTLSLSDQILTLPINCGDTVSGLNGSLIPYGTSGMQRARALESLLGSRVRLQDVDWPVTKSAQVWELVGAEYIERNHTFDQHKNRQVQSGSCVLTLRRGL